MEHRGVTFFPGYVPHGVKILHKGKQMALKSEIEEICNWWAQVEGSEFADKESIRKNFIECFLPMFDKS